jgi:two-component system sensor histidine kinase YesM
MVYQDQKNLREAELRVLQAQIKPHFLYNTLDTIQWMAREHGADDVASLVAALTKLFRLGLSGGREIIPVRDELEHVRSYLTIQQARYEDAFDYEIDVPEELLTRGILKVVLQPMVENAIYHGIKERRGKGKLLIRGRLEGDALEFRVRDDGAGIPGERLASLNALLASSDVPPEARNRDSGFAIMNVNARIRLSAGSGYGVSIESVFGEWTEVILRMPSMETGR